MDFTRYEIGQVLVDSHLGCEWIVRERKTNGMLLQINKEGGPFLRVTNENCRMSFAPKTAVSA